MSAPFDQHFLVDEKAIKKIAGFIPVRGKRVLEIGPGEGPLTRALLDRGALVIAVELDRNLFEELEQRFSREIAEGRLFCIRGDAVRDPFPPFDVVVANLPYSASSKITFRLLNTGFEDAVLMYQKEFAERMLASPGTPAAGRLSVMVQTYADVAPLLELSPNAFRPKPQVRSMVVRITPRPPPFPIADHALYAVIVRELFSHRRKTVSKSLKIARPVLGEGRVRAMLESLPPAILGARPEELDLASFARIANCAAASAS
ncbi:MAG: 16S ribosomal RNA methyltransferase A [Methanomicrobiales archaeon]|nr:16S ribosomal RNA methyltransferase A [Methanomicrobiales archaeon]